MKAVYLWEEEIHTCVSAVISDTQQAGLVGLGCERGGVFLSWISRFLLPVFFAFCSLLIFLLGCFLCTSWARW